MKHKTSKDELQQSSSSHRTASATSPKDMLGAANDEISASDMEEIFISARQTVRPIIKREAENEIVSEEILSFKMV